MSDKNEHADLLADTVRINCVHCTVSLPDIQRSHQILWLRQPDPCDD